MCPSLPWKINECITPILSRANLASYPHAGEEPGYDARGNLASYPPAGEKPGYDARGNLASYPPAGEKPGYEEHTVTSGQHIPTSLRCSS